MGLDVVGFDLHYCCPWPLLLVHLPLRRCFGVDLGEGRSTWQPITTNYLKLYSLSKLPSSVAVRVPEKGGRTKIGGWMKYHDTGFFAMGII